MTSWPLLSLLIWLPIIGGFLTLAFGNERANGARWFGLAVAFATLLLSVLLFTGFDYANPGMQFGEEHAWIPAYDIRYSLGADGISVALIGLTTLTSLLVLISAWGSVDKRVSQYYASFLILQGLMVGVFSRHWVLPLAQVLKNLGSDAAWVVHGSDGLDEITLTGPTYVAELKDGAIREFEIGPADAGLPLASSADLKGGDANYNAAALRAVLEGKPGAFRNVALLNAAAALVVAGRASDLKDGVTLATQSLDSGAARKRLEHLVAVSNVQARRSETQAVGPLPGDGDALLGHLPPPCALGFCALWGKHVACPTAHDAGMAQNDGQTSNRLVRLHAERIGARCEPEARLPERPPRGPDIPGGVACGLWGDGRPSLKFGGRWRTMLCMRRNCPASFRAGRLRRAPASGDIA